MAIQLGSPATFIFSFRRYDDSGQDLGPLDLNAAEHQPLIIVLRRPDKTLITIESANVDITDAAGGLAEWTAEPDQIDQHGVWRAQAWAGEWPSRVTAFQVLGPNLV